MRLFPVTGNHLFGAPTYFNSLNYGSECTIFTVHWGVCDRAILSTYSGVDYLIYMGVLRSFR